jgi:hypothetical protein
MLCLVSCAVIVWWAPLAAFFGKPLTDRATFSLALANSFA